MEVVALILIPLVGAVFVAGMPARAARPIAMFSTLLALGLAVWTAAKFDYGDASGFQFAKSWSWLPDMGVTLSVGIDSIGLLLILLTVLLGPICVGASTTAITQRLRTYYAWLLVLQAAMTGVFAARDLIFFYICFEFTLIPMFILIHLFGSTNRKRAAIKFFLYTFTGSVVALAGLAYVALHHVRAPGGGAWTFDIATLEISARTMSRPEQGWVLLALMAGFAVKVPLFPLHTWLPLAHTEAPTAGSVILAGVLLKLGTYAIFRFVLAFAPLAVIEYAPLLGVLCIIGIVYGGLICWVQTDVKKLVAYSSVAHLGFCMLGLFALNHMGVTGAVLYMINHGLSTGALFLLVGMVYERYHTRSMKELGGLAGKMPVWSTFMVFFALASVGLPGLNGFVSEFLCLFGAFQASSAWGSGIWNSTGGPLPGATPGNLGAWFALVAGTGVIIAAMYLLYMVGKMVWGTLVEPHGENHGGNHEGDHATVLPPDLNVREIALLLPLAVLCVVLGVYPRLVTDAIERPVAVTVANIERLRSVPLPAGDLPVIMPAANPAPGAPAKETH